MTKKKDPKDLKKAGQPTKYTLELAQKICKLIAVNTCGLNKIVKMYDLPDSQTIYNWIHSNPEFFEMYMVAKEAQAHVLVDSILDISVDVQTLIDKEGNERIDAGILGRARLQIDALRWNAAVLAPKFYRDKDNNQNNLANNDLHKDAIQRKHELDEKNKKDF
ncbi:MAG TPA: hypothetical protein VHZ76_03285 [Gammaproteobacteria bacterium]|nr:hypothetical protein [Gammaproteobacteria bacterium]